LPYPYNILTLKPKSNIAMPTTALSNLAQTLIGSEIVKLGAEVKELIRQGNTVYNFTIGDFDASVFPIPAELETAIINAYQQKFTTYPPADGLADTKTEVLNFLKENEGLDYAANEILIGAGGRPLIYAVFRAIVDKGEKVVYAVPSWNNNHYVHFTEAVHTVIETTPENNFMPKAADIQPLLKGASLLALCSPLNPTGTTFTLQELTDICNIVIEENEKRGPNEKKLYVMYDQMYWTLTFGNVQHYNPVTINPKMKEYTIFIDGISKVFAATGVRVGWALGPANVIDKMKAINSHVGAWAPMAEQKATATYLAQKQIVQAYLTNFKAEIEYRLRTIYQGFITLKDAGFAVNAIAPQAAIYLTIQFNLVGKKMANGTELANQKQVAAFILNQAKIAVVPFSAFGASAESTWYRLSVGTCKKEEIPAMLAQLQTALASLH
jgi:aspartate aminotransferase